MARPWRPELRARRGVPAAAALAALWSATACQRTDTAAPSPSGAVVAALRSAAPARSGDPVPAVAAERDDEPRDPVFELKFRWTDERPEDPCAPPYREHELVPEDCSSARRIERLMSRGGEVEIVGRPRCNDPGCGERPDLLLGYTYPNNSIFLLTPDGERFPNVCPDLEERGKSPPPRLRVRGSFEPRRGVFVNDERVFPGDQQPCDRAPHPVFVMKAWCIETRGARRLPTMPSGEVVSAEHVCGRPTPF